MANPKHVEIVKKGAEAIAAWNREHPDERLDLREADLGGAELDGADLHDADLRGAHLDGANLIDARLYSAKLPEADLSAANVSQTDLRHANLVNANLFRGNLTLSDLTGADLSGAAMRGAFLPGANLAMAEVRGVEIGRALAARTIFADVDLSEVRGLDSVVHHYPSTIGVDTLFKSKGKIPDVFLSGCGVPDELIVQLPAIIGSMKPIQFYSCFVSYNSADEQFARRLHARLTAEKLRVWYAPEKMRGGRWVDEQIDRAIRMYDRLLLVLSEKSMKSEWVRREIKKARKKERQTGKHVLFPIRLASIEAIRAWECVEADTGEDLAEKVREYHIPNFTRWKQEDEFEKAFGDLMRDLRAEDEGGGMKVEG